MEAIFTNTKNSKTNEPHRFKFTLAEKLSLKDPNENMTLGNLSIYHTWKNVKPEFKISEPTLNDEFDLLGGSYSISDILDYFEYIIKKHETIGNNPSVQIYVNKIRNSIVFQIKTG